jgi:hypothetical protein
MDNKTKLSKVYIATNMSNAGNEKDYTIEKEAENNPPWGGEGIYYYKTSPHN